MKPFNYVQESVQARSTILSTKCVHKSHINLIYMYKEDLVSNNLGGARGVMVIAVGNGHGDTSSNPGRY